jgi:hypothetical protein
MNRDLENTKKSNKLMHALGEVLVKIWGRKSNNDYILKYLNCLLNSEVRHGYGTITGSTREISEVSVWNDIGYEIKSEDTHP